MNEDRFWLLISLKLSNEASAAELDELEDILKAHPELGFKAQLVSNAWQSHGSPANGGDSDAYNKHLQRLTSHLSEPVLKYESVDTGGETAELSRPRGRLRRLAWVTGMAACLVLGWFLFGNLLSTKQPVSPQAQNSISTKRGSKSKVQLPDGTQVWLNSDSRLIYNESFQGAVREVQLSGEAFFDVVRDESRPFVIHTNTIDVKVLGTAFNVRSYEDEKNTETSLIHGSVEVTLRHSPAKEKIILKPNDKLVVPNDESQLATLHSNQRQPVAKHPLTRVGKVNFEKKDSSVIEILWVKNKLAFDGEPFEDVALKIERWFDVKIFINDEKLKKEPFSGVFDDENLQVVMEALRMTGKLKYNINKKEVTITR